MQLDIYWTEFLAQMTESTVCFMMLCFNAENLYTKIFIKTLIEI